MNDGPAKSDDASGQEADDLQFGDHIDDAGLSLEELSDSFAEMLKTGDDPYGAAEEAPSHDTLPLPDLEEPEGAREVVDVTPRGILEAMLFVGHPENRPITAREVAALMRGVRPEEIDELVVELNCVYDEQESPYHIVSEGPGYRLVLREEYASLRERFYGRVKSARLTQAAVDVLAIVAYNQPISKPEIEDLRGKPSGAILGQLVRRQLLSLERSEGKPRVAIYRTTERFLDVFGLDSVQELPNSQDL